MAKAGRNQRIQYTDRSTHYTSISFPSQPPDFQGDPSSSLFYGLSELATKSPQLQPTEIKSLCNQRIHSDLNQHGSFFGRSNDLRSLKDTLFDDDCRVLVISGRGGIGKTKIASELIHQIQQNFDATIGISMRDPRALDVVLSEANEQLTSGSAPRFHKPSDIENEFFDIIARYNSLVVLDNFETLFEDGENAGTFKGAFQNYTNWIVRFLKEKHSSKILITSREIPSSIRQYIGLHSSVRTHLLNSVETNAARQIVEEIAPCRGTEDEWEQLVNRYSGNPFTLKYASQNISRLYDGRIGRFLQSGSITSFPDAEAFVEYTYNRMTESEKTVAQYIAINRGSARDTIIRDLSITFEADSIFCALESLLDYRPFLEYKSGTFRLPQDAEVFLRKCFVRNVIKELQSGNLTYFCAIPLLRPNLDKYYKDIQKEQIIVKIASDVFFQGPKLITEKVAEIVSIIRARFSAHHFAAANLLHILVHSGYEIGVPLDFSDLCIREGDFQGVSLRSVDFSRCYFYDTVFSERFAGINAVAFEERKQWLAAGDGRGYVRVWDLATKKLVGVKRLHSGWVRSLAFSPLGDLLGSCGDDGKVILWDLRSGGIRSLYTCPEKEIAHEYKVRALCFSPDGLTLASGECDSGRIFLWDVYRARCKFVLRGHQHHIRSVCFSSCGEMIVSASHDRAVLVWRFFGNWNSHEIGKHSDYVAAVSFRPDGRVIASADCGGKIRLWSGTDFQTVVELDAHEDEIWSLAFSPDGRSLASGSRDKTIKLWAVEDNGRGARHEYTLKGHAHWIRSVAWNQTVSMIASGSDDQSIRLWVPDRRVMAFYFLGYNDDVLCIKYSPHEAFLVSAGHGITIWDSDSGSVLSSFAGHPSWIWDIAISHDGRYLASCGGDGCVRLWDLSDIANVKQHRLLEGQTSRTRQIRSVAFSPLNGCLASAGDDHKAHLWDVETGCEYSADIEHDSQIWTIAFNPSGHLLATAGEDRVIKLWQMPDDPSCSPVLGHQLSGHQKQVRAVSFSPNGLLLATGGDDATVRIWEVSSGRCLGVFEHHQGWVQAVEFVDNGRGVASAGDDGRVYTWMLERSSESAICIRPGTLRALLDGEALVRTLTISLGGQRLASGDSAGAIHIWQTNSLSTCCKPLRKPQLYDQMRITDCQGLDKAQMISLEELGAIS